MNVGYITVELVTTFMVLSGNGRLTSFGAVAITERFAEQVIWHIGGGAIGLLVGMGLYTASPCIAI
ncbi:12708_t:CDS:2, partial [Racocetra persica]